MNIGTGNSESGRATDVFFADSLHCTRISFGKHAVLLLLFLVVLLFC